MATNKSYTYSDTRDFEYTYDMWQKQMDINDEIANNKSGYMGVDTMTMKEFYDAGGYAFVDDYRNTYNQLNDSYYNALGDIDREYDRAQAGYGVQGESMAQAGLTASGYSDYMQGRAYAARTGARADARSAYQNNLTNLGVQYAAANNSFRAAYNEYVRQQQQQQWNNMLTVVQNAYDAGQTENIYKNYATAVGIPSELVDRGLEILRALNEGRASGGGLTAEDIYYKSNSKWGLTESQEQTAMSLYEDLYSGIFGTTDSSGNTTGLYADLDQALINLPSSYTPEIIAAAEQMLSDKVYQDIESNLAMGNTITKAMLDRYAQFGVFGEDGTNSEQYKALLSQVQAQTMKSITDAVNSGYLDDVKAVLSTYGIDAESVTEDNADMMMIELVDQLYAEGDISEKQYRNYYYNKMREAINEIRDVNELSSAFSSLNTYRDQLGEENYNKILNAITVRSHTDFSSNTQQIELILPGNFVFRFKKTPSGLFVKDGNRYVSTSNSDIDMFINYKLIHSNKKE